MKILVPVRAVVAGLSLVHRKAKLLERQLGARPGLRQWVQGRRVLLLLGVVAVVAVVRGRRGPGELGAQPRGVVAVMAVVLGVQGRRVLLLLGVVAPGS